MFWCERVRASLKLEYETKISINLMSLGLHRGDIREFGQLIFAGRRRRNFHRPESPMQETSSQQTSMLPIIGSVTHQLRIVGPHLSVQARKRTDCCASVSVTGSSTPVFLCPYSSETLFQASSSVSKFLSCGDLQCALWVFQCAI